MIKRWTKILLSLCVCSWDILIDCALHLSGQPPRTRGVVLYYHAVQPHQASGFAAQMDLVLRLATLWRAESPIQGPPGLHVAITFDDGFSSVVENALPVLKQRNIPFAMFFPTGSWGSRPNWVRRPTHPFWQERILTKHELRMLAQEPLVTIGSHSVSHPNFLKLDEAAADHEFRQSKTDLESVLGRKVALFSFPHGAHNARLVELARAAGYDRVFNIQPECVVAPAAQFVCGRVAVEPTDWPLEFRLKLAGAYRWLVKPRA